MPSDRAFLRSESHGTAYPSRIDLLELDIDLRLTDLWREACEVTEWNLEVVAAFMRAAYGKGYCDALTEDAPGLALREHGYRIPAAERARRHSRATSARRETAVRLRGPQDAALSALVLALSVAALLAVFLALHVDRRRRHARGAAERARGHTGAEVSLAGKVVEPARAATRSGEGLRFRLRDRDGSAAVPVVYTRLRARPVPGRTRHHRRRAGCETASSWARRAR